MNTLKKINFLFFFVIIGLSLSLLYHFILGFIGFDYPFNSFLFDPTDRFMDFKNNYNKVIDYDPYQVLGPSKYFYNGLTVHWPLGMTLIFFFTFLPINISIYIYLIIFLLLFIFFIYSFTKEYVLIDKIKLLLVGILSYPLIFSIDRANVEIYVFILTAFFIKSYFFDNKKYGLLFLSLAGAMKPYPFIFLGILFLDKKILEILFTVSLSILINFILILSFKGSLSANFESLFSNMAIYSDWYQIGNMGLSFGHTLWGVLKISIYTFIKLFHLNIVKSEILLFLFKPYLLTMLLLFIFTLKIFYTSKERNTSLMISILTVQMILFPFVSGNYRLLYMFIPLLIFVNEDKNGFRDYLYIILFGMLLIPLHYFPINNDIWSEVVLYPAILTMLLVLFLQDYIRSYYKN